MSRSSVARWYNRGVEWRYVQLLAWVGMSLLIAWGFWLIRDNRSDSRAEIIAEGRARALANCEAQNEQQEELLVFLNRLADLESTDPLRQSEVMGIADEVFTQRDCAAELASIITEVHQEQNGG